ncbi:hypothetical protein R1flu_023434 [Riccia fluitans]|uniref:Uncharacterized protein n=1 Tax=Riccia fluitans TaxID=41844 RepID=A0ABD1XS61_9MARC
MPRAHSGGSFVATREVPVPRLDLTPSRITIALRQIPAEGRSCTGLRVLATDEDEHVDNRHGEEEAANAELHFEPSTREKYIWSSFAERAQTLRKSYFDRALLKEGKLEM